MHLLPLRMDRFYLLAHLRQPPCQRPGLAANWCETSGSRLQDVFHAEDDDKRQKKRKKKPCHYCRHHHRHRRHPPSCASLLPATSETLHRTVAHLSFREEPCHLQRLQAAPYARTSQPPSLPPPPPPSKQMTFTAKPLHLFQTRRASSSLTNGHSGLSRTGEYVSRRAAFPLTGGGVIFCLFIYLFIYLCVRVADG